MLTRYVSKESLLVEVISKEELRTNCGSCAKFVECFPKMTDLEIPDTGAVFTFGRSRFAENKPSHFFIKNDPVTRIACGDEHTAVICQNGRIFAFGSNEWGQLGLGHNNMVHKPSCVKALKPEKAKYIACGRAHTIILTESNNIYACGSNTDGQLGLESLDMVNTPTKLNHSQLEENGIIKKLSAGSQHSAALTDSGLVFVWGSNSEGQLGLESNKSNCKSPTLLDMKDKIRDISCGYYHTAVLTESGDLYTFGENENGKLGLPEGDSQCYKPILVATPQPLESISCGGRHNIGLTKDGAAVAFGSNSNGELGLGREVTCVAQPQILPPELFAGEKIREVSCGESHTAFITENFKIFTCGDIRHGKLCQEDHNEENQFIPQQITRFLNYKVVKVACGGCHTIISAQKVPESLPPLQRIPNSVINTEKTEATVETIVEISNGILNAENTSNIVKEQEEQLDNFKNEDDIVEIKETIDCLLKPPLITDSVDNLLQEIEDDLSSKSGKTITSDTVSVKSHVTEKQPEELDEIDDEDLKTESAPQPEKRLSKLFNTFKRKKISATPEIIDTNGKSSAEMDDVDEIKPSKTDKTKTCTLL